MGKRSLGWRSLPSVKTLRGQVGTHPQVPLAASGAGITREGHRVVMRLVVLGSLLGGIDDRSDLAETFATAAVGEKAKVADTHKALGEDVEQKTANELFA